LPFTLTYLFDASTTTATLAARTGDWVDARPAPAALDLGTPGLWPIAEAVRTGTAVVVDPLPPGFAWPSGPWTAPPRSAIVMPIPEQGQGNATGVFIAGVNPHRPCDAGYRSFLDLLVGQIAAGLANARAYEAEKRRAEALAEIDRAKTIFFSNVSHEFRTPLTLMLGPLVDLASRPDVSDDVRAQVGMVRRNGARLLRLVNTLLDFSRIEAGRAQARYEPTDLATYTRELASTFESATERAGLALTVDCPAMDQPVYVDRSMWEKIVLNLISNAFKFTFEGQIAVSIQSERDCAVLRVTDTGVGIPPEELPRLFERFHRVEGSRGRSHAGSGIGLALVQELAKLHGGNVEVASTPGVGTTFSVRVPLGHGHLPAEHVSDAAPPSASVAVSPFVEEALQWLPHASDEPALVPGPLVASPVGERERIVVADDSADMRDYIARLLSGRWQVEVVPHGREALAAIRRERPHLVITDMMMPELDGFGLLEALRADEQTRDLPVLVLSARAGDEARIEGLEAGASDYLVKPFSARELLARVEAQLLRARVRAVEEAHARRLAAIFAQAPVAIAILRGPEHVFEITNPSYVEIIQGRAVLGKPLREALPEVVAQGYVEILDDVVRSGQPYVARSQPIALARASDGVLEQRYFDFVFQPLVDHTGGVDGVAAVGYDVTELSQAREAAEVANRAKDEFLAMLGHELRNPLAPILTALQLLRLRGVQAAERERQVIERQVQHLVSLVDDLLDVSRITRGKIQLNLRPVAISEVIAKAIETASPLLEQKGHDLRVNVPRDGLVVEGDADRLAQVVANLLTNAAKYTEHSGRITVRANATENEVVIRVEDSGIGIAPDMLPRVFDLFVQERQALDRAEGGLGLGLAIVRSLVTLHGGRVEAHSDGPGRGSAFIVHLPLSATAVAAPDEAAIQSRRDPDVVRRVLVVDDNVDAATMLADALTMQGHVTCVASDGVAALRLAAEFRPEVILLDIGLPVMDGYEVARRFTADQRFAGMTLVAVTGYGQEQDRRRSAAAGFRAHFVKPIDLERLLNALEHGTFTDHA
jgi:signal transduction histidine kinase